MARVPDRAGFILVDLGFILLGLFWILHGVVTGTQPLPIAVGTLLMSMGLAWLWADLKPRAELKGGSR